MFTFRLKVWGNCEKRCTGASRFQRGREWIVGEEGKRRHRTVVFTLCVMCLPQIWLQCATDDGMGGKEGRNEVRDWLKVTQSYKRLAVGEKCNTAEENRQRQTDRRHEESYRDRKDSCRDIQTGWLILMMSHLVRSVYRTVLTCSSRQWWVMSWFKGFPFLMHMDSQISKLAGGANKET